MLNQKKQIPAHLKQLIESKNIAELLPEEKLQEIGMRVFTGYVEDKVTQREWINNVDDAQRLAKLVREPKNTPLPNSANIKFPLITNACYQFAARTYPEIVQDGKVVKCEVIGEGKDEEMLMAKAHRISIHMSYQLIGPDNDWEAGMDKLLTVLPNIGFLIKKTYYDPIRKKNVSLVCNYKDIVLRNGNDIATLDDLRRITHDLYVHVNDLVECAREGIYLPHIVDEIIHRQGPNISDDSIVLHEQHRYLDLDGDGYEEPYIVTTEDGTNKVLRIVARYDEDDIDLDIHGKVKCITAIQFFTDFHFLRSTDGSFMSVGFGTLMLHLNETVNTILNQLIDAGSLANMQGGFIDSRLKLLGGQQQQDPGQWNRIKGVVGQTLKDGVLPIQYKEPSNVLFQLLGMLIEAGKELSSSTQVMDGTANPQNVPATTIMALVEQGMKVFNGIQRRMYGSLKLEYQKLFRLNAKYLNPIEESEVVGVDINQDDYKSKSVRVIPIADPNLASDAQRMAKVQFLMSLLQQPALAQHLNVNEVLMRAFTSVNMPNIQALINQQPPGPDPKMIQAQAHAQKVQNDTELKQRQQALKEKQFVAALATQDAKIKEMQAKAVSLIATAGKAQHDAGMNEFKVQAQALNDKIQAVAQAHKQLSDTAQAVNEQNMDQQRLALEQAQAGHSMAHANIAAAQNHMGLVTDRMQLEQQKATQNPAQAGKDEQASEEGQE